MTNPSTTHNEEETIDDCPQCGAETILEPGFELGQVCASCGVVITEDVVCESTTNTRSRDGRNSESWTNYSKVTNSTEKQVVEALRCLEQIGDELGGSSSVREKAAKLYGEASIANATDGRPTPIVIGAVLILASREEGVSIPIRPITEAAQVNEKSLKRLVRILPDELDYETVRSSPMDYLTFFQHEFDLDRDTVDRAYHISERVTNTGRVSGSNPAGTAAAAIYLASEDTLTQREVAEAAGISTETVRVRLLDCRAAIVET